MPDRRLRRSAKNCWIKDQYFRAARGGFLVLLDELGVERQEELHRLGDAGHRGGRVDDLPEYLVDVVFLRGAVRGLDRLDPVRQVVFEGLVFFALRQGGLPAPGPSPSCPSAASRAGRSSGAVRS